MSETKQVTVVDQLKSSIKLMEPQFKMALPPHISVEKFVRVIQTALQTNKDLVESDRTSFFAACMKSAQEGLLPDGKEAAIVTFKDKSGVKQAQFMPMVGGILKKVRNSGELSSITAQLVYEKDKFKYWIDSDGEHIEHEPQIFGDRGVIIGVYALAKMKDEAVYIEVMTMDQIEAVKKSSRASQYGPWAGPFATEMFKKSVIRRLSKRLPLSTDIESTIHADDNLYEFDKPEQLPQTEASQVEPQQTKKTKRMAKLMESQAPNQDEPKDVTPQSESVSIDTI
jgi:recombination protein RecT